MSEKTAKYKVGDKVKMKTGYYQGWGLTIAVVDTGNLPVPLPATYGFEGVDPLYRATESFLELIESEQPHDTP